MSHWNYRVLRFDTAEGVSYAIHETYYDDNGKPNGYRFEPPAGVYVDFDIDEMEIGCDPIASLRHTINQMIEALGKPILDAADL